MSEDGESRRRLRTEIRYVHETMVDNLEELQQPESTLYDDKRAEVNAQFKRTTHSREQLLDAENLKILSFAAKQQASKINNSASTYNFNTFADAIRNDMLDPETFTFSWRKLGRLCGQVFRLLPPCIPLHGPIGKGYVVKERKRTEKPRDELVALSKPETVEQNDDDEDVSNEATNARITKLKKILIECTKQLATSEESKSTATVDLIELLVDTQDKVQTVENFFDFAFLLQKKISAQSCEDAEYGLPRALAASELEAEKQQLVVSLGMKDLTELNELIDEIQELEGRLKKVLLYMIDINTVSQV